jgi:hypothetical protein
MKPAIPAHLWRWNPLPQRSVLRHRLSSEKSAIALKSFAARLIYALHLKKLELQVSLSQNIIDVSGLISTFEDVSYRSIRTIT